MRKFHDWAVVQRHYNEGHSMSDCRATFGISYGGWRKAIKRGKLIAGRDKTDARRRHDWAEIRKHYEQGNSFYDCMRRFRFCRGAWHKAVKRGEIRPRPLGRPLPEVLASGRSRTNLKRRLIRAGLLENRCQGCGLNEWLGEPLSIQIDHINGIRNDNRLENLQMLCANCHSQTPTYGRRPSATRLQETGQGM